MSGGRRGPRSPRGVGMDVDRGEAGGRRPPRDRAPAEWLPRSAVVAVTLALVAAVWFTGGLMRRSDAGISSPVVPALRATPAPTSPPLDPSRPIASRIAFVDDRHGWVAALSCSPQDARRCVTAVEATSDGGSTWRRVATLPVIGGTRGCAVPCPPSTPALRFVSTSDGVAYGRGYLGITRDGGAHWDAARTDGNVDAAVALGGGVLVAEQRCSGIPPVCPFRVLAAPAGGALLPTRAQPETVTDEGAYAQLVVAGGTTALLLTSASAVERAVISVTRDGGASWHTVANPCPRSSLYGERIAAAGRRVLVVCGGNGEVGPGAAYASADAAATFTRIAAGVGVQDSFGIIALGSDGTAWLTTPASIVVSRDGGHTWSVLLAGLDQLDFALVDATHAVALRGYRRAGVRVVSTSDDGGISWSDHDV